MESSFLEIQRFTQRWLWIVLMVSMLIMFGVFGYGIFEQLFLGKPWGNRPISDEMLIVVSSVVIIFCVGMTYLFYTLRLIVRINDVGISVRFYPFRRSTILFSDISSCAARTYKPLREYGGWGIKYGRSGKAYSISGNRGVQLLLKNGKKILIGSQHADELAAEIIKRLEL